MLKRTERTLAQRQVRRQSTHHAGTRLFPDQPEGFDSLPQVEHIVILMMENHSYDNYLGTLEGRGDGFPVDGQGAPVDPHANRDEQGALVGPRHLGSTQQQGGVPTQSWHASHLQWDDGACDGFPRSIEVTVPGHKNEASTSMGYWNGADLPFYHGLAHTFPLATRWFSSCLGPTFPNRRFLISGTAHGLIDDVMATLYDEPPAGTIFDLLTAHGISWANYHNKPRWKTLAKSIFGRRGFRIGRRVLPYLAGIIPKLEQFVVGTYQFTADMYPRELLRTYNHALSIKKFFSAARDGTLPSFCIVDPDFGKWSEENPQDVQVGEGFSAAVIQAVMDGPGWGQTLLIWLYDEHGGYYDHVPPPAAPEPDDVPGTSLAERFPILRRLPFLKKPLAELDVADAGPRTYDRYGFRVPAVIVSPYARRDYVSDQIYDHTSILKLVEQKWNLPSLTNRDAAAAAPLDALDFLVPAPFLAPPVLPSPTRPWTL
jgi:phospholipase C